MRPNTRAHIFPQLATLLCLGTSAVQAQIQILPDFQADPTARVFNGKLYIYPSHDLAGNRGWDNMYDWHVFSTDDMTKWTDHGVIFGIKDIAWANKQAWAPDCIERNGKYYFYFPAAGRIGVAVADSPTGRFKDALGKPLIAKGGSIDPCVFIDDDGQAYLYFGGYSRLSMVKLKEDMITLDGPIEEVTMPNYHEGIWVHKRNGIYYASYPSPDGDNDKKSNLLEYSMSKSPLGPWEHKGVILDNRSRNVHGAIVEFKKEWYLIYHVAGLSAYERRVCMERVVYNEDGTIKPMQMSQGPTTKPSVP
ncbi:MAG: family 43 glycosylhydrolase [Burkholderiales bacterium]|nr:family 43 glycosylhydrolase [Phycisphaerae bacterium]